MSIYCNKLENMKKSLIIRTSLIISDILALWISLISAVLILNLIRPGAQEYIDFNRLGLAKIFGLSIIAVFWQQNHYNKRIPIWEEIKSIVYIIFIFSIVHFIVTYLVSHHIVKMVNVVFWFLLLFILPLLRYITKLIMIRYDIWQRKVYIIGTGDNAIRVMRLLSNQQILGLTLAAFININEREKITLINKYPVYKYSHILTTDLNNKNDVEIIFALDGTEINLYLKQLNIMQIKYPHVSLIPDIAGLPLYEAKIGHFFGSDEILLSLKNNLSRKFNHWIKRFLDILLSILGIIIFSPFFLIIAIMIKLTGNNVFFKHKRIGRYGNYFYCLKFQTMYKNSQQILDSLLDSDKQIKTQWEKEFKLKNDPRVTKIGKFLRKTSLDELPQLFNVLNGEMSIVGPRPIIKDEVVKYKEDIYYYYLVRPGITGLWQISGRNDIDYPSRVRLDVWYVKNWSMWHDFVIILRTFVVVLKKSGAY
jgi:Undecaprenyl-phosphate galactose phosphotransferase WbaP